MNNARRKTIDKIIGIIENAKADLETILNEEQEAYDNMLESLQSGDKGDKVQEAMNELEEAIGGLESAIDNLGNAKGE